MAQKIRYCSNCGAELPEKSVFCFQCGKKIADISGPEQNDEADAVTSARRQKTDGKQEADGLVLEEGKCAVCGSILGKTDSVCPMCGFPVISLAGRDDSGEVEKIKTAAQEYRQQFFRTQQIAEEKRKEKEEQERLAREKAAAERRAKEIEEEERKAKEKAEQERQAREKAVFERRAKEIEEEERKAKEKAERERQAREKAVAERRAKEIAEEEREAREKTKTQPVSQVKPSANTGKRRKKGKVPLMIAIVLLAAIFLAELILGTSGSKDTGTSTGTSSFRKENADTSSETSDAESDLADAGNTGESAENTAQSAGSSAREERDADGSETTDGMTAASPEIGWTADLSQAECQIWSEDEADGFFYPDKIALSVQSFFYNMTDDRLELNFTLKNTWSDTLHLTLEENNFFLNERLECEIEDATAYSDSLRRIKLEPEASKQYTFYVSAEDAELLGEEEITSMIIRGYISTTADQRNGMDFPEEGLAYFDLEICPYGDNNVVVYPGYTLQEGDDVVYESDDSRLIVRDVYTAENEQTGEEEVYVNYIMETGNRRFRVILNDNLDISIYDEVCPVRKGHPSISADEIDADGNVEIKFRMIDGGSDQGTITKTYPVSNE